MRTSPFPCKFARRAGHLLYDPAVAVDHYTTPGPGVSRPYVGTGTRLDSLAPLADLAYNEVLAIWDALRPSGRMIFPLWSLLIGTGVSPGFLQAIRFMPRLGGASWRRFRGCPVRKVQSLSEPDRLGRLHSEAGCHNRGSDSDERWAMRFCVITPSLERNDGQGRVNLEIVLEAARQGHKVTVVAETISLPECSDIIPVRLTPPTWLRGRLLRDQLFAVRTWLYLRRHGKGFDALLVNGFVTWAQSDINAVHFVHRSWLACADHPWRTGRSFRSIYAGFYSLTNVFLERHALRRSGRVVAVSRSVAGELTRVLGPASSPDVISNGVDLDEFHPGPMCRSSYDLPEKVTLALFAGDLKSPRKNLDTVLRALRLVPTLHLVVAGRHAETSAPALAQSLGVADRVHFLGFRRDMPEIMRGADVFVFPSRYEPCGLVLLEAIASGVPVITSRSVGGSELIEPQAGVVLDDCNDVEALASALADLVVDRGRRRAMAANARLIAQRHSWEAMDGSTSTFSSRLAPLVQYTFEAGEPESGKRQRKVSSGHVNFLRFVAIGKFGSLVSSLAARGSCGRAYPAGGVDGAVQFWRSGQCHLHPGWLGSRILVQTPVTVGIRAPHLLVLDPNTVGKAPSRLQFGIQPDERHPGDTQHPRHVHAAGHPG